jgi:hypothetical protein
MSTEISANKGNLWGRIILLITCLAILCYSAYVLVYPKGKHIFHEQKVRDWSFLLFSLVASIGGFIKLYSLITGVIIDEEQKVLEIKYLCLPNKTIYLKDIAGYGTTVIKTRSSGYQGINIHLADGGKILLSDLNLTDSFPVELFLGDSGVKKMGEE